MDAKILLGEMKALRSTTMRELKEIRSEIADLNRFKWKVMGAAGLSTLLATLLAELLRH